MFQDLVNTFEELKKYVFIIDRGKKEKIIIKFRDEHFYHLVGLHKIHFNSFIPSYIKTREKQYKYMKKHIDKYNNVLKNQTVKKDVLLYRIKTFSNLLDLLKSDNTILYNLKEKVPGSMYDGDYGLLKIYEEMYCLLGLKEIEKTQEEIYCVPQSWMANNRENNLTKYKVPLYMNKIIAIPIEKYDNEYIYS